MQKNRTINGHTFNRKVVDKLKTFDEFYNMYKDSAYAVYDKGQQVQDIAKQKALLQDAWAVLKPVAPKKEDETKK